MPSVEKSPCCNERLGKCVYPSPKRSRGTNSLGRKRWIARRSPRQVHIPDTQSFANQVLTRIRTKAWTERVGTGVELLLFSTLGNARPRTKKTVEHRQLIIIRAYLYKRITCKLALFTVCPWKSVGHMSLDAFSLLICGAYVFG